MTRIIHVLAKRRFNFVDVTYLGLVVGLVALGRFWTAVGVFCVGVLISVVIGIVSAEIAEATSGQ